MLCKKQSKTLTILGACLHAAAVASRYQNSDIFTAQEITISSRFTLVHRNTPRTPMGDWWRKRGLYIKRGGIPAKTDMMPAATGAQDEKVTPFPYKITSNKCGQWIVHNLSIPCDERRRPRRGAPAADQ